MFGYILLNANIYTKWTTVFLVLVFCFILFGLVWLTVQNRICISMLCTRRWWTSYIHLNTFPYHCTEVYTKWEQRSAAHLLILLLFHIVWLAGIESPCMPVPEVDAAGFYNAATHKYSHSSAVSLFVVVASFIVWLAGIEPACASEDDAPVFYQVVVQILTQ